MLLGCQVVESRDGIEGQCCSALSQKKGPGWCVCVTCVQHEKSS